MTKYLKFDNHFSHVFYYHLPSHNIPGEGNGNSIQYSCLENPMDGGAWCPWGHKELDTIERLHFHFSAHNNSSNTLNNI